MKHTAMQLPKDLGQIEFLREHPMILEKLIERSRDKSLEPFIKSLDATYEYGGFEWEGSEEGFSLWEKVRNGYTDAFYERYPRIEQPQTEPKTDIAQIRYHMEQIELILKKIEAK
jgi:hypothetical protein